jgi:hypothetical protein
VAHGNPESPHRHLASSAASCLGVDLLETETRKLAEAGFNVIVANLTREPLDQLKNLTGGYQIELLASMRPENS